MAVVSWLPTTLLGVLPNRPRNNSAGNVSKPQQQITRAPPPAGRGRTAGSAGRTRPAKAKANQNRVVRRRHHPPVPAQARSPLSHTASRIYIHSHVGVAGLASSPSPLTNRRRSRVRPSGQSKLRARAGRDPPMSKSVPSADAPPSVAAAPEAAAVDGGGGGVRSMVERWKMEAVPARARLALRALAWLFSLLALVVMASNQHGGGQDFSQYPEYKSAALAVSIHFSIQLHAFAIAISPHALKN